jgi:hypothetical protein
VVVIGRDGGEPPESRRREDTNMYVHPEFLSALIALRQAEIQREVRGEHSVR